MYTFRRFLYISALICIISIHIHSGIYNQICVISAIFIHIGVDMYNFYAYPSGHVYFSAIFIHIGVDMYNFYTYRVIINRTTHAESDALPDESDPRSLQARCGYSPHRYVRTRHPERHRPPPHSRVSSQNPVNSDAATFQE